MLCKKLPSWCLLGKQDTLLPIYICLEHSDVSGTAQGLEVQSPVLQFPLLQCLPYEEPLSAQLGRVCVL